MDRANSPIRALRDAGVGVKYPSTIGSDDRLGDEAQVPHAPVIEELTGVDPVPVKRRADRWLGLATALGIAVIGFGVAGRLGTAPPGGIGPGAAVASPGSGSIGSLAAPTSRPRVTPTSPSQVAPVPEMARPAISGSISVRLQPAASSGPTRGEAGFLVDGHAPSSVESVTVDIRTSSGVLLASAVVQNALDDERPGTNGGRREGVGRIHRLMFVPGPIPAGGWQVDITWRSSR